MERVDIRDEQPQLLEPTNSPFFNRIRDYILEIGSNINLESRRNIYTPGLPFIDQKGNFRLITVSQEVCGESRLMDVVFTVDPSEPSKILIFSHPNNFDILLDPEKYENSDLILTDVVKEFSDMDEIHIELSATNATVIGQLYSGRMMYRSFQRDLTADELEKIKKKLAEALV